MKHALDEQAPPNRGRPLTIGAGGPSVHPMSLLTDLVRAIDSGTVEVVDLTAPLSSKTPILTLPERFGQTWPFALTEISRYNDAGPAWYWNNISTGEHTGTHFDAPIHWVTGKDGADVSQVPVKRLIAASCCSRGTLCYPKGASREPGSTS